MPNDQDSDGTVEPAAAAVKFPPPLVLVGAIAIGLVLDNLVPLPNAWMGEPPLRYWAGGFIVAIVALGISFWAVQTMRSGGQSPNPWSPVTGIVERGPYRFSRNPMYLQLLIALFGVAILFGSVWMLILTPVSAAALQWAAIGPEEAYLEARFGEPYRAYKRRVRRWF